MNKISTSKNTREMINILCILCNKKIGMENLIVLYVWWHMINQITCNKKCISPNMYRDMIIMQK